MGYLPRVPKVTYTLTVSYFHWNKCSIIVIIKIETSYNSEENFFLIISKYLNPNKKVKIVPFIIMWKLQGNAFVTLTLDRVAWWFIGKSTDLYTADPRSDIGTYKNLVGYFLHWMNTCMCAFILKWLWCRSEATTALFNDTIISWSFDLKCNHCIEEL